MRVVALISGGKDSCYNMMHCVAEGHEVVALANLRPQDKDELDSYMYQTVGHHAIDLYAEALGLPLYRRTISGSALETGRDYVSRQDDEVEDLFLLLQQIKDDGIEFNAVASGAILSHYQRVRVENVCSRLGLTSLAYLWRQDQCELLCEMIQCGVKAIVIKVAALGLTPEQHLGHTIEDIYEHMIKMKEQFGLNICGEGGEYETFTLDCPLFQKKIILDEVETVLHSDDAFAPVAYLNLRKMHLEEKNLNKTSLYERVAKLPMRRSCNILSELFTSGEAANVCSQTADESFTVEKLQPVSGTDMPTEPCITCLESGMVWISGVVANRRDGLLLCDQVRVAMDCLADKLDSLSCSLKDMLAVYLYVYDMADFSEINNVYGKYFSANPPIRVCVQAALHSSTSLQLDCLAYYESRTEAESVEQRRMHVQSVSFWAPANIGPYSQAVLVGERIFVAGQIGLNPAKMTLVDGGAVSQSRLGLRHASRVLEAMCSQSSLCDVTLAVCYITSCQAGVVAKSEWSRAMASRRSKNDGDLTDETSWPLVQFVVVPALPHLAEVEWQVTALTSVEHWNEGCDSCDVPSTQCTIHCSWRYPAGRNDLLSFLVTADHSHRDDCCDCCLLLPSIMNCTLRRLQSLLSDLGISHQHLGGLRLFCSLTGVGVHRDFCQAFRSVFSCDVVPSVAVVPVCRFLSPTTLFSLCPA